MKESIQCMNFYQGWPGKKIKTQISNIKKKRKDINTNHTDIQRVRIKYYTQFYVHKFNKFNEMEEILKIHKLDTQEEIGNLNYL